MSVKIRLRRTGAKKRPYYRIVVADSRTARNGRFIEIIGNYQPIFKPALVNIQEEKVYEWLKVGAQPTPTVNSLFRKIGLLQKWDLLKRGEDVSAITLKTEIKEIDKLKGKAKAKAAAAKTKAEAPVEEAAVVEETPVVEAPVEEAAAVEEAPAEETPSKENAGSEEDKPE